MPEGDTIFRTARTLQRALAGRTVTRFESPLPALMRVDEDEPIARRTVRSVRSLGKHLLIEFSGDLVLLDQRAMAYPARCARTAARRDWRIRLHGCGCMGEADGLAGAAARRSPRASRANRRASPTGARGASSSCSS